MTVIKTLLIMIIIVLSVDFVMQNRWIIEQGYEIQYHRYKTKEIPLVLLFLGNVLLGALLVSIPSFIKNFHLRRALRGEHKRIVQMEKELNSLRNLPITDEKAIERID
ncbi:MAG: LapA family protein [bacterium]